MSSRYVLVGLSRIAVRVARTLAERGQEVVVVSEPAGGDETAGRLLSGMTRVVPPNPDREAALREAGLEGAASVVTLSDDDLENLHAALAADAVAPAVPIVLRAFDPVLVDRLAETINVRRAFSVSALAAPAFVAAALGEEVETTLRLGDEDITLFRLRVRSGSPLDGRTAAEVKADHGCALISRDDGSGWRSGAPEDRLTPGELILVGGPLRQALALVMRVSPVLGKERRRHRASLLQRLRRARAGRRVSGSGLRASTLLPAAAAVLVSLLVLTVVVFAIALRKNPIDATYFAVTTALGNATLDEEDAWLKVFGVGAMIAGGALLGVVFSYLAAVATAERLEEQMGRRARGLANHVVLAGLGTIGFRIEGLLGELGVPVSVIERSPTGRFVATVVRRTPVVFGDARLPEDLDRAGVDDAACFIACTDDELTNVSACLQVSRLNPRVRTVARVFDDALAERARATLGIDAALSASGAAAAAFVGAATAEHAPRPLALDGVPYVALRFDPARPLPEDEIDRLRARGLRVLAFRQGTGPVRPPSELRGGLEPGDSAILVGPEAVIRETALAG